MKIFGWMQRKLKSLAKDESIKKPNSNIVNGTAVLEPGKEDVNEWLQRLLAIGTLGTNEDLEIRTNLYPTSEEIGNLLRYSEYSLLHKHDDNEDSASISELEQVLSLQIQSCLESKEVTSDNAQCSNYNNIYNEVLRYGGKDVCVDKTKKDIGKKSLPFLLKKMLVCRSGFLLHPPTSPRPPIPESRMEKILRAIIHKKIYPQSSSSPILAGKKYLESYKRHISFSNANEDDTAIDKASKGSKWVKTDSEYIVLEI